MTNRREFIQALGAAGAMAVGHSLAANAIDHKTPFAGAFSQVPKQFAKRELQLEGQWPKDLNGQLYRNSAAMLERDGFQHSHLFDGDGMVQKFSFHQGRVFHQAEMVATDKYMAEEKAGRFLYHGLASSPPAAKPGRNNDSANVANISVRKMGDKLFALWEAGSAYEIDPDSLATHGRVDWADELKHLPFSAHPLRDANGDWWNIGSWIYSGQARTIIYQLDAKAKLKRTKVIPMNQAGYMHAFALSQRFLILVNTAHLYRPGQRYFDSFRYDAKGKTEIVLLDKNDLSVYRTIDIPANFVFHFGNAFEIGDELFITMAEYDNADVMSEGLGLGPHSAFAVNAKQYNSDLSTYRIELKTGKWHKQPSQLSMEFPSFREESPFTPQTLVGMGRPVGPNDNAQHDYLISHHPQSGAREIFDFGKDITIEEPLFVRSASGHEYVMHTLADRRQQRSALALFNAGKLAAGPIAMAWAKEQFPFGFHGCFVPS